MNLFMYFWSSRGSDYDCALHQIEYLLELASLLAGIVTLVNLINGVPSPDPIPSGTSIGEPAATSQFLKSDQKKGKINSHRFKKRQVSGTCPS